MNSTERDNLKQHREIRSLKDALLAEKHSANQLRDLIATLNAALEDERELADTLGNMAVWATPEAILEAYRKSRGL